MTQELKIPLVIYHADCLDGLGAAYAVWARHGGAVELLPASHGEAPPIHLATGRHVYVVDFSYQRDQMRALVGAATCLTWVDHHKTALESEQSLRADVLGDGNNMVTHTSLGKSGAVLAWEHMHGEDHPVPKILEYIQDRDLWQWKLPGTKEITLALAARLLDSSPPLSKMNSLNLLVHDGDYALSVLLVEGRVISLVEQQQVGQIIKNTERTMVIGGHRVPVCNAPHFLASEVGHALVNNRPAGFAATYQDTPAGRLFSLRSRDDKLDVGSIARAFGGGGHRNAAGFRMPTGWEGDVK